MKDEPWMANSLFAGIAKNELLAIKKAVILEHLVDGEQLIREGSNRYEDKTIFYIIKSGELDVYHQDSGHTIARLAAGANVGLMGVIDQQPRSANVRAHGDSEVYRIDYDVIQEKFSKDAYYHLMRNTIRTTEENVRKGHQAKVSTYQAIIKHEQSIHYFGQFFTVIILSTMMYMLALEYVAEKIAEGTDSVYYSISSLILLCMIYSIIIYRGPYSFGLYGITTKGAKQSIYEALLTTLPLLIIFTVAKYIVLYYNLYPALNEHPFFILYRNHSSSMMNTLVIVSLYMISVVTQEFFSRGVIQSTLHHFFTGKYADTRAVLLSVLIFAALHLYIDVLFALLVIIPGLYWGILYARSRNLIGVCISHALIGVYTVFILGVH